MERTGSTNSPLKIWRPTRQQVAAAYGKTLVDVIAPDLKILWCGINPSLYSAAVGHHFARPGNRFWPALHLAEFTDRLYSAFEDRDVVRLGYGITNVVNRATANAAELTDPEYVAGGRRLAGKIRKYRPQIVAMLGLGAYRTAFQQREASVGPQPERIEGALIWVLPSPSGLNAHYQLPDLARVYGELRREFRG